jgi:hypothetical protein
LRLLTHHLCLYIRKDGEILPMFTKKERETIFSACQLNYQDYQPLDGMYFRYAFFSFASDYMNRLQNLNSEEQLIKFLDKCSAKKHLLQALAGGLMISEKVILKPRLNVDLIKSHFTQRGLMFDSFSSSITIEEFLKAQYDLKN